VKNENVDLINETAECKSGASGAILLGKATLKQRVVLGFVLERRRQTQRT
jgi:hypothetical protein